jgi:hypothetical protein
MRQRVLWFFCALLMVAGGVWLVALLWLASDAGGYNYGPHAVGSAIAGITLARVLERRPVVLAASASLGWSAALALATRVGGFSTLAERELSWSELGLTALISGLAATAGASLRLRGRRDHRLLWLWISGLVTMGSLVMFLYAISKGRELPAASVIGILATPLVAGAFVQVLAPRRMIWSCGGGMLLLVFFALDDTLRGDLAAGDAAGTILGLGIFVLLGALGARLGWFVFRHGKAPPATTELPMAITRSS